jgi:hypothetical protein
MLWQGQVDNDLESAKARSCEFLPTRRAALLDANGDPVQQLLAAHASVSDMDATYE